jgi:hypothetical protein
MVGGIRVGWPTSNSQEEREVYSPLESVSPVRIAAVVPELTTHR